MHASHASCTHTTRTCAYLAHIRMPGYACLSHMPMRHTYTRTPHTYACLTHTPTSLYLVRLHSPHSTSPHSTSYPPDPPPSTSPHLTSLCPTTLFPAHLTPPHCTHKAHTKVVHLCIYVHIHIHIHIRTPMRTPLGNHWVSDLHLSADHQAYAARPHHCTLARTYIRTSAPALSPASRTLSPPHTAFRRAGSGTFPRSQTRDRRWGAPKGE